MISKKIKFTDYNGNEHEDTFYFHISKAEALELETEVPGGLSASLKKAAEDNDATEIIRSIRMIILKAYGVKSEDGMRFKKSKEILEDFEQSEAFSELLIELLSDGKEATAFVTGILPKDLADKAVEEMKKEEKKNLKMVEKTEEDK